MSRDILGPAVGRGLCSIRGITTLKIKLAPIMLITMLMIAGNRIVMAVSITTKIKILITIKWIFRLKVIKKLPMTMIKSSRIAPVAMIKIKTVKLILSAVIIKAKTIITLQIIIVITSSTILMAARIVTRVMIVVNISKVCMAALKINKKKMMTKMILISSRTEIVMEKNIIIAITANKLKMSN